jgi:heptaprenylglyceryl phosphate synthase
MKTIATKDTVSWTFYVLSAVKKAKQSSTPVILDVGKESSASLLQDALMALAMNGEDAAWNVDIKLHKHIH